MILSVASLKPGKFGENTMDKWHLGNTFFRHLVGSCCSCVPVSSAQLSVASYGDLVVKTQSMDWFIIIFSKTNAIWGYVPNFWSHPSGLSLLISFFYSGIYIWLVVANIFYIP
jgi:hypothetical protein